MKTEFFLADLAREARFRCKKYNAENGADWDWKNFIHRQEAIAVHLTNIPCPLLGVQDEVECYVWDNEKQMWIVAPAHKKMHCSYKHYLQEYGAGRAT